jgi:hypothetical protein
VLQSHLKQMQAWFISLVIVIDTRKKIAVISAMRSKAPSNGVSRSLYRRSAFKFCARF